MPSETCSSQTANPSISNTRPLAPFPANAQASNSEHVAHRGRVRLQRDQVRKIARQPRRQTRPRRDERTSPLVGRADCSAGHDDRIIASSRTRRQRGVSLEAIGGC
jgi:phage tail tape-measure protein